MSKSSRFRWKWLNYSGPGHFFLTFSVKDRDQVLSVVKNDGLLLLPPGEIVAERWKRLAQVFSWVKPKDHIVMPDHFHGIIWFDLMQYHERDLEEEHGGKACFSRVSRVVRHFKSATTMEIRRRTAQKAFRWQEGYIDRFIRNDSAYCAIQRYIRENPDRWIQKRRRSRE